jgi:hypothetical protein
MSRIYLTMDLVTTNNILLLRACNTCQAFRSQVIPNLSCIAILSKWCFSLASTPAPETMLCSALIDSILPSSSPTLMLHSRRSFEFSVQVMYACANSAPHSSPTRLLSFNVIGYEFPGDDMPWSVSSTTYPGIGVRSIGEKKLFAIYSSSFSGGRPFKLLLKYLKDALLPDARSL